MKKLLLYLAMIVSCAATLTFTACEEEDFGYLDKLDYSLLTECMWVPEERVNIPNTDEIPSICLDPQYPACFSDDAKTLTILCHSGGNYTLYKTYDVLINTATNVMTMSREGEKTYVFRISILTDKYLTIYFGDDEENWVIYERAEMPPELIVGRM